MLAEVIKTHPLVIFGDRVLQNMYYVPPAEYLAGMDAESALQRTLDRIQERANVEDALVEAKSHLEEEVAARTSQLSEALEKLEAANRAKSRFMANMSHDLRTPLNSVIGFSGTLLHGMAGELSDEQRRQVEMINKSGLHLLALVNDVLDIERIESGTVVLEDTVFDLTELAHLLAEDRQAVARQVGLALSVSATGPVMVRADELRLKEVLLNLLDNALKFTASGTVELAVDVEQGRPSISVRDTGRGIPPDAVDDIFEEFVQLEETDVAKTQGTGLGLAIARKLTEMMGGTIEVASTPGVGSTFTVRLPAERLVR